MSSLAATQADGYYYPKDWRPEHGSLNQFRQSHPLGKRAKNLASDGVLVVRFEMPFDVWCTHCDVHIGRGVRFNARKKKSGNYFSSTVWEFRMNCASCSGELVIRTDPKERGYELTSGVKKKAEATVAIVEEAQTERLNDPELAGKLQSDPFFRLEHENEDKRAARKRSRGLEALVSLQEAEFKDDYASNSALRAQFRSKKKQRQSREKEAKRLGLGIPLLDVHPDDVLASRAVVFKGIPQRQRSSHRPAQTSKPHSSVSRKSASAAKADSFQHFGDPMGSQLQRLKVAKRAAKKRTMTSTRR